MDGKADKGIVMGEDEGIHVVAKPIGPTCNLNCEYCFYLDKQALFSPREQHRMSDDVLSAFITNYITSQPTRSSSSCGREASQHYWVWIFLRG